MRRRFKSTALAMLCAGAAWAEPQVPGYDRFHSAQPSADGGRLLYNELGCVNCHGSDTGLPPRRGPDLTTVTVTQKAAWLQAFIANPSHARAGSPMPQIFHGRDAADAEAVVHYLGKLTPKGAGRPKLIRHINSARGSELFHTKGCVACHAPGNDFVPPGDHPTFADAGRAVALTHLADKYVLASLAEFIRDPLKTRRDGRMPRIEMEEQDARDIAGYLIGISGSDGEIVEKLAPFAVNAAKAEQGRSVVKALRCAACHDLPGAEAVLPVPLQQPDAGCLAESPGAGMPRYALNAGQRQSLQAYLLERTRPLDAGVRIKLSLEALNCVACHERDGHGGPDAARKPYFLGDSNLGDTGRYPPPLTGVGRKLQPAWLEKAIRGAVQVRPYLQTQMPSYGNAVAHLPALFAEHDRRAETPLPHGDVEAGRKLLGTNGGVSCITCHSWGERASLGIHALDISNLAARLQPGWLREYLVNPAGYRPGTLMPAFWPEGKASNREVLAGDTDRQIASIIAFAREGTGLPEGFPSATTREFELMPTQRPIVLRTFFEGAGTHAILVGFPAGVHLAYDGRSGRPALAWKGRFFDAYGTWFSRFAPFEKPLGESLVSWPLPKEAASDEPRCKGYRLDPDGIPIFLLSVGGASVEERFEPVDAGLRRSVRWKIEELRDFPVLHPAGVTTKELPESEPGKLAFIYTWP